MAPRTVLKVLKSDAQSADAWLAKTISPTTGDVWLTFDIGLDAAALTAFSATLSGYFGTMFDSGFSNFLALVHIYFGNWDTVCETVFSPTPATGWTTLEVHYNTSTFDEELYAGGSLISSCNTGFGNSVEHIVIGQRDGAVGTDMIVYFRNILVGTTRGDDDIFSDDFSSNDFSNWTTTSGAVSLVTPPF